MSGLKRAGTLQGGNRHPTGVGQTAPPAEEEDYKEETELVNPYEDESYYSPRSPPPGQQPYGAQGQGPASPMGRSSPWNNPGTGDWRVPTASFSSVGQSNLDDVTRALSTMELNNAGQMYNNLALQSSQSTQPPRFNPPTSLSPGMSSNYIQGGNGNARKLQLDTDLEGRKTPTQQPTIGPVSDRSLTLAVEHPKGVLNSADLPEREIVQSLRLVRYHGIRKRSSLVSELQTPT